MTQPLRCVCGRHPQRLKDDIGTILYCYCAEVYNKHEQSVKVMVDCFLERDAVNQWNETIRKMRPAYAA